LDNYIYEIGGLYLAETGTPSKEVFRYSINEDKWEKMTPLPEALGAVSAVLIDKTIQVFGGIGQSGSATNSHYVYDIDSNVWSEEPTMPFANNHMAVATDGVKIFFTGGSEKLPDSTLSRLFIYNSKTKLWQEGPKLPTPRGDVYGAIVGKYFIVAGGENNQGKVFDVVEGLDLDEMTWKTMPRLHSVRHGGSAVSLDGYFYLLGGRDANHSWGYTSLNERLKIK
jgi:N-acetylneuraminic acid mutarotase